jgi:WD40 repeat protein
MRFARILVVLFAVATIGACSNRDQTLHKNNDAGPDVAGPDLQWIGVDLVGNGAGECAPQVLQVPDGVVPAGWNETPFELVFSPNEQFLAARLGANPNIWIGRLSDNAWRSVVPPVDTICLKTVFRFRFFPDGQTFAAEYCGGSLAVWNENQVGSFQALGTVASYAVSPDGRLVATSAATQVSFFNSGDGSLVKSFDERHAAVVEFAPGGDILVAGGDDSTVRLLDVASGAELVELPAANLTWKLAVSGDGRFLGAMTYTGVLEVWRMADYQRVGALSLDPQSPDFALTADGRFVVTSGAQLSIYETDNLSLVSQLGDLTYAVAVSPSGKVAASQSGNRIVIYCL